MTLLTMFCVWFIPLVILWVYVMCGIIQGDESIDLFRIFVIAITPIANIILILIMIINFILRKI
jgi:hypothetical protein